MGYDLMVLDSTRSARLAFVELDMAEWGAAWDASRLRSLPMLKSLPDFYGDERTFPSVKVHALISELDLLDSDLAASAELVRASQKLREIARAAIKHALPLLVVPD